MSALNAFWRDLQDEIDSDPEYARLHLATRSDIQMLEMAARRGVRYLSDYSPEDDED